MKRKKEAKPQQRREFPKRDQLKEIRALARAIAALAEYPSEGDFVFFSGSLIKALQHRYESLHYKYIGYLQDPRWCQRLKQRNTKRKKSAK